MVGRARRALRLARAHLIYRLDALLGQPPLVQVAILFVATALVVAAFAAALQLEDGVDPLAALWWSTTHFLDGGTMAADPPSRRALALAVTSAGVVTMSLLTAALASKMGERIADLRSGLNPVLERDHVLVLGYDPNVALFAREIARSGQACTLVVLASEEKERIEAALRPASRVPGQKLRTVVRTGDPRSEQSLLRVSAEHARAVVIVPPPSLGDEDSVRWTLATLLAMRRVAEGGWGGHVIVEARRREARALLELAAAPGIAGPGALPLDVVASDDVIACILAQSTRDDAVYFVLRHLLAFDGCELYLEPLPRELEGRDWDEAHARVESGIVVGLARGAERPRLCPAPGEIGALRRGDRLVVLSAGHGRIRLGDALPEVEAGAIERRAPAAEEVSIIGVTATLPHLLRELDAILPAGSTVRVLVGPEDPRGPELVAEARASARRIAIELEEGQASSMALEGTKPLCTSDAIVILGHEDRSDENGDASALAMLLRLRHGMKVSGNQGSRVVTELRDPRSARHVVPRPGDCIVSSDVVAMLLAQEALDPAIAPVYREVLHPGGTSVRLRPVAWYGSEGGTFGEAMARARARGEIAIGIFPDPRAKGHERDLERARLEEGDSGGVSDAWLNPPRDTRLPRDESTRVVVLARASAEHSAAGADASEGSPAPHDLGTATPAALEGG